MNEKSTIQAARDVRRAYPERSAASALQIAREALAADAATVGRRPVFRAASYGYSPAGKPFAGAPFNVGAAQCYWVEKPDAHGLRDCGDADAIVRLDHRGWFVGNDREETAKGCVYRWGRFYVPAIRDPHNDGPIMLAWGDRQLCADAASYGASDNETLRDCARTADHIAECYADEAREYDAASQAGARWRDLGDEATTLRGNIRATLREAKQARDAAPGYSHICAALREKIGDWLRDLQALRDERAKLATGDYVRDWLPGFDAREQNLRGAFCDGAGIRADQFARIAPLARP